MPKKTFEENYEYDPNINGLEILVFAIEKIWIFFYLKVSDLKKKVIEFFQKNIFLSVIIILVIAILMYGFGGLLRQGVDNISNSKLSLIEKVKQLLIAQSSQDKLDTLDQIESKIISDVGSIGKVPILGNIVQSDVFRIKQIVASWIEIVAPFGDYKLSIDGLRTTLLQKKYFTDDLEMFLDKSPELINKSRSLLSSLWIYRVFGSDNIKKSFLALESYLDIVEILSKNKNLVLRVFGHFQTQRIVVFNQNTGEARPNGGFLGSYIPIDISKGEMIVGVSQSIYTFDQGSPLPLVAHPATWYYGNYEGLNDLHGARNSNMFACFPDTAKYLEREFSKSVYGYNIDDLVMITPDFLLGYLPDNFELEIDNKLVPKSQILNVIERMTAFESVSKLNPKEKITSIFGLIVSQLPQIIKGQSLVDLIIYTQNSLKTRQIQIWLRDLESQSLWSTTGYSGENTCLNKQTIPVITPLIINISGDKRNLIAGNDYEFFLDGNNLKIKYTQILPRNAEDVLQRGFNVTGFSMIGFQLPKGASLKKLTSKSLLALPFQKPYYFQTLNYNQAKYLIPKEIQDIINSSVDFGKEYNKGFSYLQPDGSEVVGGYFLDEYITEVEFDINLEGSDKLIFLVQPGQSSPVLRYGGKIITDKNIINEGIRLR